MRINTQPKLNFDDVLLEPKTFYFAQKKNKDVDMTRKFTFRNPGKVVNF